MLDMDVWGTVKKMREIYGARASIIAKQRADRAREDNDIFRYDRWKHIAAAVSPKTKAFVDESLPDAESKLQGA
jgi:hypothetical protein